MRRRSAPLDENWSGVNRWKSDGSQSRGAEVRGRAGGRMRGRAGAPADACAGGQVARMRALLAKARTRGWADRCQAGERAGGWAGGQRHVILAAGTQEAGAQVYRI